MSRLIIVLIVILILMLLWAGRQNGTAGGPNYVAPWPWRQIADCETGGDSTPGRAPYNVRWHYNGRSGFDGGLQFLPSTWTTARLGRDVRHFAARYPYAWQAPAWIQVEVARSWLRRTSYAQWPYCSRLIGLR